MSDREHAAAKIVERLDDPQWREPLLLALGLAMISPEWGGPQTRFHCSMTSSQATSGIRSSPDIRTILNAVGMKLRKCFVLEIVD